MGVLPIPDKLFNDIGGHFEVKPGTPGQPLKLRMKFIGTFDLFLGPVVEIPPKLVQIRFRLILDLSLILGVVERQSVVKLIM